MSRETNGFLCNTYPVCYQPTLFSKISAHSVWKKSYSSQARKVLYFYSWPRCGSLTFVANNITTGYQIWLICIRCVWFHFRIGRNGIGKNTLLYRSCIGAIFTRSNTVLISSSSSGDSRSVTLTPGHIDIINMTWGRGQWPSCFWKLGWFPCARYLEKSVFSLKRWEKFPRLKESRATLAC